MTIEESTADIISQLSNGSCKIEKKHKIYDQAIIMLKEKGIIEVGDSGYHKRLTAKGHEFKASGLSYEEWVKSKNMAALHIGHNINAPVNHSDLSIEALNRSIKPPIQTHNKQTKIVGILKWIISNIWEFILSFVIGYCVWYFTMKKH